MPSVFFSQIIVAYARMEFMYVCTHVSFYFLVWSLMFNRWRHHPVMAAIGGFDMVGFKFYIFLPFRHIGSTLFSQEIFRQLDSSFSFMVGGGWKRIEGDGGIKADPCFTVYECVTRCNTTLKSC